MKPLVSVIIAIYYSEIWLPRCLRSAISQALERIGILLIDDGSTVKLPSIGDEFSRIDPRIRVFHRQNHDICGTRQFGLALISNIISTFHIILGMGIKAYGKIRGCKS